VLYDDEKTDCGRVYKSKFFKRKDTICKKKDKNGIQAKVFCPLACGYEKDCSIQKCIKNDEWQSKNGAFTNCNSIKNMSRRKKKKTCSMIGADKKTFAYESCKHCGICNENTKK